MSGCRYRLRRIFSSGHPQVAVAWSALRFSSGAIALNMTRDELRVTPGIPRRRADGNGRSDAGSTVAARSGCIHRPANEVVMRRLS